MTPRQNPVPLHTPPEGYDIWRKELENLIARAKFKAVMGVNTEMLSLYWKIGHDILEKQKTAGWGRQVIDRLAADLARKFPDDRGYSVRNLNHMRRFAKSYPDFPYLNLPPEEFDHLPLGPSVRSQLKTGPSGFVQVPLAQIPWYHHISLLSKVEDPAARAFYIIETAAGGWSRDMMLTQVAHQYIHAKGQAVNNFEHTLPPLQSELAKYVFKDPYQFSFIGTVALQNELDIEKSLARKITDFLLEMGRGFAFVGRQYHIEVDGDDYYIDILMYHLQLHCYVVVELKAVEFIPEFVSKLNFYISAVDDSVKSPDDKPTIGLLLCRTKSDKKAQFALRGITQPMGIAQYETEKLFADVASSLPQIELLESQEEEPD